MDEIELVDYDPRWPSLFDHEARRLRSVLDPHLIVGRAFRKRASPFPGGRTQNRGRLAEKPAPCAIPEPAVNEGLATPFYRPV